MKREDLPALVKRFAVRLREMERTEAQDLAEELDGGRPEEPPARTARRRVALAALSEELFNGTLSTDPDYQDVIDRAKDNRRQAEVLAAEILGFQRDP